MWFRLESELDNVPVEHFPSTIVHPRSILKHNYAFEPVNIDFLKCARETNLIFMKYLHFPKMTFI